MGGLAFFRRETLGGAGKKFLKGGGELPKGAVAFKRGGLKVSLREAFTKKKLKMS